MRRNLTARRGITAVLAMMYLVLFSTLALGFFATMTSSAQLSGNDQRATEARLAAESGMQFMKYHLWGMRIPKTTHRNQMLEATYAELSSRLDGTTNMKGKTVGVSADGTKVFVPGPADAYISVDGSGMEFRATIERYGEWGLRVTTVGRANPSFTSSTNVRGGRGIELQFENRPEETSIFEYGMAARGPVTMDGNSKIVGIGDANLGNMLIASETKPTLTMLSNATISGNVAFTDSAAVYVLSTTNNKIGGVNQLDPSFDSKISTLPKAPEFPAVDTEPYQQFAGAAAGYGGTTVTPPNSSGETMYSGTALKNVLVKASPHPDRWVVFDNGTIDGIVYIETPNKVRFTGSVVIRGAVVVQNDPTYDYTRNKLEFLSNAKLRPIESLAPLNDPNFPAGLTSLVGASILAPAFELRMDANFGSEGGSIIADKILFDSNATGSINGNVITLAPDVPVLMNGNATINVVSHAAGEPVGARFTSYFKPLPGTYKEVKP